MLNSTTDFHLSGLHCESCKKISEKRVEKIEGVSKVTTDLETGKITIIGERVVSKQEVVAALEGTGYQVN